MALAPGSRLGPYEVLEPLGAGGMGEVWKALDTRLDRFVAVKVLQGDWAEQPEWLSRFRLEAKAVAALNHPNILSLFDLGTEGPLPYAVMELLEGETLRDRLLRGPLAVRLAIELAQQAAHGLAAAHGKGIVHRDLKPENLWITHEGRLKILDFGLAKQPEGTSPEDRTQELRPRTAAGLVMGTVGYMSPEQVRGEPVDARSDLFALGAVLWEMLMGRKAFGRASTADTMAAILKEDPGPLAPPTGPVPPGLQRVLQHCLDKRPEGRFQSARDLAFALEAISEAPSAADVPARGAAPSLAVLPFVNLSQSREQDYFSDGISEEIINALMNVAGLRVAARTSSFAFRNKPEDVRRIGEALGVQCLLEGSVRIAGEKLRVSAQLIAMQDGCQLWSGRFDRSLEDVFEVQDEIAKAIAAALEVKLLRHEEERLVPSATEDPAAYDLYLRGRAFYNRRQASQAIACFEEAIARDPDYAEALTGLADAFAVQGYYGGIDTREAYARARAAADQARALKPEAAEPLVSLAILEHYYGWDFEREEALLQEALRLNPRLATACYWMALLFNLRRMPERGIPFAHRCIELDPLNPNSHIALGMAHYSVGRFEEACPVLRRAHEIDAVALLPIVSLSQALLGLDRPGEAVEVLEKALLGPARDSSFTLGLLGRAYGRAGRVKEARRLLDLLRERARSAYVAPLHMAFIEAGLGDREAALGSFHRAVEERNALTWYFLHHDPGFAPLREAPGFEALRSRSQAG